MSGVFSKLSQITTYLVYSLLVLLFIGVQLTTNFIPFFDTEYCLLCIGFIILIIPFIKQKSKFIFYKVDLLITLLFVYTLIIFFINSKSSVFIIHFWIRIGVFFLFYALRFFSTKKNFNKIVTQLIFAHFSLELLTSILQYFNILKSVSPNFKVTGTFSTPNFLGAYLSVGVVTLVWYGINYVKNIKKPIVLILFLSLLLSSCIMLVLTLSRASWLALAVSLCVLIFQKKVSKDFKISKVLKVSIGLLSLISIIAIGYYAYNLKKDSANGRLFTAKILMPEIENEPIFGHGLFSFPSGYNNAKVNYFKAQKRTWNEIKNGDYIYHAFNDYLEIAYEIGLLGLGLFILIIFLIFKYSNWQDHYAFLGCSLLVLFIVFAIFSTPLTNEYLLTLTVLITILCLSKSKHKKIFKIKGYYLKGLFFTAGIFICAYSLMRIQKRNTIQHMVISNYTERDFKELTMVLADNGYADFFFAEAIYHRFNRKLEALELMEKAVSKNKAPKEIQKLANYYLKQRNFNKAEKLFLYNIQNEPYRYEARMDLVKLYKNTHQITKLKPLLKEIIDFPIKIPSEKVNEYKRNARKLLRKL